METLDRNDCCACCCCIHEIFCLLSLIIYLLLLIMIITYCLLSWPPGVYKHEGSVHVYSIQHPFLVFFGGVGYMGTWGLPMHEGCIVVSNTHPKPTTTTTTQHQPNTHPFLGRCWILLYMHWSLMH